MTRREKTFEDRVNKAAALIKNIDDAIAALKLVGEEKGEVDEKSLFEFLLMKEAMSMIMSVFVD